MNNEGYETKKIEKQLRLTFKVLRVTNINFLLTTSEIIKSKGYENYLIDYRGSENTLILNQILSTILKRNVWRSVWRICMWILGLNGLKNFNLNLIVTCIFIYLLLNGIFHVLAFYINIYFVVDFLSQEIFVFLLFLGMVIYANKVETKGKKIA